MSSTLPPSRTIAVVSIGRDDDAMYCVVISTGDRTHKTGPWSTVGAALDNAGKVIANELTRNRL